MPAQRLQVVDNLLTTRNAFEVDFKMPEDEALDLNDLVADASSQLYKQRILSHTNMAVHHT